MKKNEPSVACKLIYEIYCRFEGSLCDKAKILLEEAFKAQFKEDCKDETETT